MKIQLPCESRSWHLFLLFFSLGLCGVGVFAFSWGMRNKGIDSSALLQGGGFLLAGVLFLILWIWLIRRVITDYIEVDPESKRLRLFLVSELHSDHPWSECGKLWVQPVFRTSGGSSPTKSVRHVLWLEGFQRPLFTSDSRYHTEERAQLLAKTCGFKLSSTVKEEKSEFAEQLRQISHVHELVRLGDESTLLENLDQRVKWSDPGQKTAMAINELVISSLGEMGTEYSLEQIKSFSEKYYKGNPTLREMSVEAIQQIEQRNLEAPTSLPLEFNNQDCTVLVFYGVEDDTVEPDATSPSLVMGDLTIEHQNILFLSDVAPNLMMLDESDFMEMLREATSAAGNDPTLNGHVQRVEGWAIMNKSRYYLYELEPPAIAGDGSARQLGLKQLIVSK